MGRNMIFISMKSVSVDFLTLVSHRYTYDITVQGIFFFYIFPLVMIELSTRSNILYPILMIRYLNNIQSSASDRYICTFYHIECSISIIIMILYIMIYILLFIKILYIYDT